MRNKLIKNAKSIPEVYFGMHFYPGVAEYAEAGKDPYRILLSEETIRKMNSSFAGRPLYVEHVEEVRLENLQEELDGVVVRSFYNPPDGKTWVEFVVISDEAKQRIREGWRLSNAYFPKTFGNGGLWNGVEYEKEVLDGEFEHLAIVQNPRYDESKILTRDQFKEYNESLESELKRLQNSNNDQKEKTMGLKFFKKTKVENSIDLESTMVELPLSKHQISLVDLVAAHDKVMNMHGYAAGEHMVKVNDTEEMSVNDMIGKYNEMSTKMKEAEELKNAAMSEDEDGVDNGDDADDKDREKEIESKKNEEGDEDEDQDLEYAKKKSIGNKADKKPAVKTAAEKEAGKKHFNALKNAQETVQEDVALVNLMEDQVARGRDLYGSGR